MLRAAVRVLVSCTLLAAPATVTAAPILVNGGFETGPVFSNQDLDILPGSSDIPGWTIIGGGVDLLGSPWDVSEGVHAIDLDRRSPGGIEQTFGTAVGQTYLVSFDLSGNPGNGQPGTGLPPIKQLRVSVGDVIEDYAFDSTGLSIAALAWQPIVFSFLASDVTATLSFVSLSPDGNAYGALIDNVSVTAVEPTPVPEPSSLILVALGLLPIARSRWAEGRKRGTITSLSRA